MFNNDKYIVDNLIDTMNKNWKDAANNKCAAYENEDIIKQQKIRLLKMKIDGTKNISKKIKYRQELNELTQGSE